MNSMNKTVQLRSFHSIFTGLLYAFITMGILIIIFSLLLTYTQLKEESLPIYLYVIHAVSLMIGGLITGNRIGTKGWYYGGLMGIVYCLIVFLVGFLSFDSSVSLTSLLLIVISFTVSALGGIIGVNFRK